MGNMKLSEESPKKERTEGSLRKINKPLMEKRRRARINNCLSQLKVLVLDAMKRDTTQISKLEKADILEMTVRYLRNVQSKPQQTSTVESNHVNDYKVGFQECASEVMRYVGNMQHISNDVKSRMWDHLNYCASQRTSKIQTCAGNSTEPVGCSYYSEPLNVNIPNCGSTQFQKQSKPNNVNGYLLIPANRVYIDNYNHSCLQNPGSSVAKNPFLGSRASTSSSSISQKIAQFPTHVTNNISVANSLMQYSGHQAAGNIKASKSPSNEPVWRPW